MLSLPKDTARLSWTRHIKNKMVFYHLSGAQVLRIFRRPDRREEGIAPGTSAAMKTRVAQRGTRNVERKDQKLKSEELWIMYKVAQRETRNVKRNGTESNVSRSTLHAPRVTMISAWRYPGVTKVGERPEIPADALSELEKIGS